MDKYVTVVSVDDQLQMASVVGVASSVNVPVAAAPIVSNGIHDPTMNSSNHGGEGAGSPASHSDSAAKSQQEQEDSQFVTVLSINHGGDAGGRGGRGPNAPEVVLVYRLPGERLGFGLKFQGGTKSNEKIARLFIQSCAENSPASRVQASWGHLREGDEILEIDGVSVTRMTRIECVKCLKDSNVAIKLLVRNGEGKVQNFYSESHTVGNGGDVTGEGGNSAEGGGSGSELPERKGPPSKVGTGPVVVPPPEPFVPPPDPETYSNLFAADDISDLISESDDTASTISTVVDKFSICSSSLSSEDYTIPSNGPNGIGQSIELAKALKPFTLLEQEFNLESKFETTNLFTFKPPPPLTNVVQLEVPAAAVEKPPTVAAAGEYENVTIMKVDENRNYENVAVPYGGPYENVTIQTVQPYENMVLHRAPFGAGSSGRRLSSAELLNDSGGVYENVDLKAAATAVPPRPLPRQAAALVEPKKRAPIPVPIPIVVPPPRLKPTKQTAAGSPPMPVAVVVPPIQPTTNPPSVAPLGAEYNTIQNWLQEATEVIHECALVTSSSGDANTDADKTVPSSSNKDSPPVATTVAGADLPRLIDFHPKVSHPMEGLEEVEAVAPPASPTSGVRYEGPPAQHHPEDADEGQYELPEPAAIVRKCIKIISSEDHTYIESSSSDDDDDDKMYRRDRSEDEDDRSSVLSREATTPEQFLSGDGYSDEDGEKLGPPEIVSGGPSEAYFNFPWTSNLLPPIGEVEEEFSSLEHQQNGPIVIIDTADETVINDTNNNQQRERKKPLDDESPKLPHSALPSSKIVTKISNRGEAMSAVMNLEGASEQKQAASSGMERDSTMSAIRDRDGGNDRDQADSNGCFTPDSLDEAYDEPEGETQEPEEPGMQADTAAMMVVEECVNIPRDADNADEKISVQTPTATCEPEAVPDGANSSAETGEQEQEQNSDRTSVTMEDGNECAKNEASGGSALVDKAALPSEANPIEIAASTKAVKVEEDDSNIDAICGDVDIVVGDTVESDFEELVKAQVEPLDVEDSSEQIQQIHERIIVGIERAVSDEGDDQGDRVLTATVGSDGATVKTVVGGVGESDTSDTESDSDGAKVVDADKDVPETDVEPKVESSESIEVMPESTEPAADPENIVQREMENAEAPIEKDPTEQGEYV
ncbi:hypothetical protein ZHAS_00015577 [Anopheles sinensis]|uniref:PDZ domain-containing protein n=1 Tax=Anopheles sinensis TaxID=74873 RepID=A0A084WBL3_ANOSI|nr:hypothetical protein ZHAS_00015577 [Anopheles sinensis]